MQVIRFSSNYPKLHNQTTAELIAVRPIKINKSTPKEFLEYDTKNCDGNYYELKSGNYLQLIFLGNLYIPFCTIRSAFPESKVNYYTKNIGEVFNIAIENNK